VVVVVVEVVEEVVVVVEERNAHEREELVFVGSIIACILLAALASRLCYIICTHPIH